MFTAARRMRSATRRTGCGCPRIRAPPPGSPLGAAETPTPLRSRRREEVRRRIESGTGALGVRTCGELVDIALLERHVDHLQLPQRPAPHHLHPPPAEHAPLRVRAQVRDDGGAEAADV